MSEDGTRWLRSTERTQVHVGAHIQVPFAVRPQVGEYYDVVIAGDRQAIAVRSRGTEGPTMMQPNTTYRQQLDAGEVVVVRTPEDVAEVWTQVFRLEARRPGRLRLTFRHHPAPGQQANPDGYLDLEVLP